MNSTHQHTQHSSQNSDASQLLTLRDLVSAHQFAEALEYARVLRAAMPRNIFIAGLETQLLRLVEGDHGAQPDASAITSTLLPLLDRAIESSQKGPRMRAAAVVQKQSGKSDREKAIDMLKLQYFAHADNLMKKGDFDNALSEVRRIQLLDPADVSAHQYIQKLEELYLLQLRSAAATSNSGTEHNGPRQAEDRKFAAPVVSLDEMVTMMNSDFDSILAKSKAAQASFSTEHDEQRSGEEPEAFRYTTMKSKATRVFLVSGILIAFAIVASYFLVSGKADTAERVKSATTLLESPVNTSMRPTGLATGENARLNKEDKAGENKAAEPKSDSLQIQFEQIP